jgi:methylated-DNA-protein-cysteine methyltransferase related protein
MRASSFERVHRVVQAIPAGQVATYGQIARILGMPRGARTVGWALRAIPAGSDLPWHRVVNSRGQVSLDAEGASVQRALLEQEGVLFDEAGCVNLALYGWPGPDLYQAQEILRRAQP